MVNTTPAHYLEVLESLEKASSSERKDILAISFHACPDLTPIMDAVYNFHRKFNIKQIPTLGSAAPEVSNSLSSFLNLLTKLETREISGDAARDAVKNLLEASSELERKWLQRILLKDLRCNIGIATVQAAGFKIPQFEVMLAKDGHQCKKINEMLKQGVFVSHKLDGYRCPAVVKNYEVTLYTRNGKEFSNFPQIAKDIETMARRAKMPSFFLDGEVMSNDFQAIQQSAFASTRGTTVGDITYHAFDLVPIAEWESQNFKTPASRRYADLAGLMIHIFDLKLVEVKHELVYSMDSIIALERKYVEAGFEGAMVIPDIPYYLGRKSNAMLKFKTMESMDCKIEDYYLGEGKYESLLGGLVVRQENGVRCDVGSGFTDAMRAELLVAARDGLLTGRICEVKYQNLSNDGVMRFPIFIRFRDQGDGSKI